MRMLKLPQKLNFPDMSGLVKVLSVGALLSLGACSDDEDGLQLQPHDENTMMGIMHEMMEEMEMMPMNEDPDVVFARMMIMHHQGAINMANEELSSGDDAAIQAIATKIIADQQQEIQELQAFISSYQPDQAANSMFNMELMDSMEKAGRQSDLQVLTGDTDQDFAQLMIVHHQSAVENARAVQEHGTSAMLKEMAHRMINAQMAEIGELQEWLLENKTY